MLQIGTEAVADWFLRAWVDATLCRGRGGAFASDRTLRLPLRCADGHVLVAAAALMAARGCVVALTEAWAEDASTAPLIVKIVRLRRRRRSVCVCVCDMQERQESDRVTEQPRG